MPKTVWYKNGIELQSSDKTDLAKVTVKASASTETATYQCVAKNDLGQVSSSAQFLVLGTFCVLYLTMINRLYNIGFCQVFKGIFFISIKFKISPWMMALDL